jgi:hypothetical protein
VTCTARETYQRPSGSRETVTDVGSTEAGSTSGQDQTTSNGASIIFAGYRHPSRRRNADRV